MGSIDGGGQGDKVSCGFFLPRRKPVSKDRMNSRGGSKRDFERERCWRGEKRAEEEEVGWGQTKESRRGGEKAGQQWG